MEARAGAEAGPFQQLPERRQAFGEPLGETLVVTFVKFFRVDVGSHGRSPTVLGGP
jgi:hypothetical protein